MRPRRHQPILLAAVLSLCAPLYAQAQVQSVAAQTRTVAAHSDTSPALRDMPVQAPSSSQALPWRKTSAAPPKATLSTRALLGPRTSGVALPTLGGLNIEGVGQGFQGPQGIFNVGAIPPDTNGAVGDTQYVQIVNISFAVFDKATGAPVYGPVPNNTVWQGFGGACETTNSGDPVVLFDKAAHRWIISQLGNTSGPIYYECIAVSQTADATGAYNRYSFQYTSGLNDYPKIGVWPDAYYITFNIFPGGISFSGPMACAYDRQAMLAGQPAAQQCVQLSNTYSSLLPADVDGNTPPPAGAPNYLLSLDSSGTALDFWKFHVDWATPGNTHLTGPIQLPVAAFQQTSSLIPQLGVANTLDDLSDRLMHRFAYRNFGDHESLVANHTVDAGAGVAGIRWYEIRNPGAATPTVYQQATYTPDSSSRWMGSVATAAGLRAIP
jgi:hypothetical protein